MATINPNQEFDVIHTLTFSEASGTCPIRLHRGSSSAISGTVYYRAGTSGDWTSLSVSGTSTTFPVTSTTMQIAHNWNKSGNNYMTPSFYDAKTITSIAISQKSALTGAMGNYFMYYYAYGCSKLTSLAVPNTSGLTSVGDSFMRSYAYGCSSLTSLAVPDTSGLTSVGNNFMANYARGCSNLTSLAVLDTSGLTSVGTYFMYSYAYGCSSLTELVLPAVGWFKDNNVNWSVPSGRLGNLKGRVLDSSDLSGWRALTAEGKTLHTNYIRNPDLVYYTITLSGCSTTETRTAVKIGTAVMIAVKSITPTRTAVKIGTAVMIAVKSITPTRTMLSADVTAIIRCRSPTPTRAGISLQTPVFLSGRSVTNTRTDVTYISGVSCTETRTEADLETGVTLAGASFTATDATADIKTTISLSGRTATQTRAKIEVDVAAKLTGKSATGTRAELAAFDTLVTLPGLISRTETRAIAKVDFPYKQLIIGLSVQERQISMSVQEYKVKLEVEGMPLIGNTIRIIGESRDYNKQLSDLTEPKFIVLDSKDNKVCEATPERVSLGVYQYDYIVPGYDEVSKRGDPLVCEISGTLGGKPSVGRVTITRTKY